MNAFSRGHLFYVSSGGFIKYWAPLYNSESPTQVAVTTIKYCALTAKKHREKLDNMYLFYDNMVFDYLAYIQRIFFNLFGNIFPGCTGGKTCKSNQILTLQCNLEWLKLWKADQKDLSGECKLGVATFNYVTKGNRN